MFQTFYFFLLLFCAGCMTTRPPLLQTVGPSNKRFSAPSPYDNVDNILTDVPTRGEDRSYAIGYGEDSGENIIISLQLGMRKQNVQIHLGSPTEVAVAGLPKYGNERWTYEDTFATVNGYMTATKHIYFENHVVVGWEID